MKIRPVIMMATTSLALGTGITAPAMASPAVVYSCIGPKFSASVELDEEGTAAYLRDDNGTYELRADPNPGGPQNAFSFSNGTAQFRGLGVDAQLNDGRHGQVECWQTGDSQKAIALYGGNSPNWSPYNAPGQGFQTVRAGPDTSAKKLASLPAGSPVTILENTDKFYRGYWWFRIQYDGGKQGYMWGALLCSDVDNPELNQIVRRCN